MSAFRGSETNRREENAMNTMAKCAVCALAVFLATSPEARGADLRLVRALRELAPPSNVGWGEATPRQPWQTALYLRSGDGRQFFTCGGSLIAPSWVLTAAHCFAAETSKDPADWTVAIDFALLSLVGPPSDATTRKVKRLVANKNYDPKTRVNDIAVLELTEPLPEQPIAPQMVADNSVEAHRS